MNLISKSWGYILAHKTIAIVGVLVLGGGLWYLGGGNSQNSQEKYVVQNGEIMEEVAVTGRIQPVQNISMAFENTGRIMAVYKNVGARVYSGEVIASLDLGSPMARLNEEKAKLEQLKRGSRPEEISIKEADVAKATQDLTEEYGNVFDTLNDAYVKSEDAVRVKTSALFSGNLTNGYKLAFVACDTQSEINTNILRAESEVEIEKWKKELNDLSKTASHDDLEKMISKAQEHLIVFRNLLENTQSLLNQTCILNNSSFNDERDLISSARSSLATAISAVWAKASDIKKAHSLLSVAQSNLNLTLAGSDPEDIKVQESKVSDAQAEVSKYQLRSPINGIVTKQDAKVGEIAYANTELVSLISDSSFEIKVDVPELDIARIKKGNVANVTMDAYGSGANFAAIVTAIDPAETIVDNVPKYKVTLVFKDRDERIKSGLTANVYITTNIKTEAMIIPSKALISRDGKKYVTVEVNGVGEEKEITLGIRGNRGYVEVLSGLSLGDTILIPNAGTKK